MSKLRAGEKSGEKEGVVTSLRLTPKQDNFCFAYLETGNASEAYRRSYNTNKMKPETINKKASILLGKGEIRGRLEYLKSPVIEKAQLTLEAHLDTLAQLRDEAREALEYSAAITAETNRGKAAGLYVTKIEAKADVALTVNIIDSFKEGDGSNSGSA